MSQKIIAFSGRKQSGKNTACNFLTAMVLAQRGITSFAALNDKGQIWVKDLFGDKNHQGIFDISNPHPDMQSFLNQYVDEHVRLYSMADALKSMCINVLGLTWEQCYGTDEDKMTMTNLRWEDMPGVITKEVYDSLGFETDGLFLVHEPGYMTAREVLQFVGTDIFRKMYGNVWVDATMRNIVNDGTKIALVSDVRFPNEVDGIQKQGGVVIRLTRNGSSKDVHESETALDRKNFDWDKFDSVINNAKMSIQEQNEAVCSALEDLNIVVNDNENISIS